MATFTIDVLEFLSGELGDFISTEQVTLDRDQAPVSIEVVWYPETQAWGCTVRMVDGTPIVVNATMCHREDIFANIVTSGRPRGALVPLTEDGSTPDRDAWTKGGRLVYIPEGLGALLDEAVASL